MNGARYAIYYAPAVDSPWWRFGAGWLGWDERRGTGLPQPRLAGFSAADFHRLTTEPRRYGFHATLKAPFRLRAMVDEDILCRRVEALARYLRPAAIGPLQPVLLDNFVALVPRKRLPAVDALATRCAMELDDLRAPITPQELEHRQPERLAPRARGFLERYGYPWVLDLYRFHLTLSGPVDPVTADQLVHRAAEAVAPLNAALPPVLDRICVFREDHPGAPFARLHEQELAA